MAVTSRTRGRLRILMWSLVGLGLIIGLAWVGENNPFLDTNEITVIQGSGQDVQAETFMTGLFNPGGFLAEALDGPSATHVATTTSNGVTVDVYTYESVFNDLGVQRCVATMSMSSEGGGGGGGGAGCPIDSQSGPNIGFGVSGSSTGESEPNEWLHTGTLVWGSRDAAWMLTETSSGQRMKSNVVNGNSIVVWHGSFTDQAETVTIYDEDANVLLTREIDEFHGLPSMPDVATPAELGGS